MSILLAGNAGVVADLDEARNVQIFQTVPGYASAGGWYSVAGRSGTGLIAAALATDTSLMSARLSASSIRKAYITRMRVMMVNAVAGASAGTPSIIGLQKTTTATLTGGTTRTSTRLGPTKGTATDITDIRDSNTALGVASVVFTDEIAQCVTPTAGTSTAPFEWIMEFPAPLELSAGDGIVLRTRQLGPATAQFYFTYTMYWFER